MEMDIRFSVYGNELHMGDDSFTQPTLVLTNKTV